ncbi:glycerate kinase [Undibacterium amnicola]|uniref:Glycerate kinase n=1 Tax=Undibacterium amnicola TaxID=1834038 RepID=A0ABR6XUH5_9BURK|nr:glycerate kinase [Undibacterium amnicola]MBC3833140.1 glycerate kinase [Undibacterium amnicola]
MTNWNQAQTNTQATRFLRELFAAALAAVDPRLCLPPHLPPFPTKGRCIVVGAGKAAASMAQALEQHWFASDLNTSASNRARFSGMVIVPYGYQFPCEYIQVREAAHPVPDHAGYQAACDLLDSVKNLSADDTVICLLSGGGSSLMSLPAPGISLAEKQEINRALLRSGARIHEINCVRKHLSAIKGGRLALACAPAKVLTYIISDVAGDDASIIASGPTLADTSTCADALAILQRYAIPTSPAVLTHLQRTTSETPKSDEAAFIQAHVQIIANAQTALQAAADYAQSKGVKVEILSDRLEGEARELGRAHAQLAIRFATKFATKSTTKFADQNQQGPYLLLSGGETTVTVKGDGRGGRNTEYLLSLCQNLQAYAGIYALAVDTDGRDGSEQNAGAWCTPDSLQQAAALSVSASTCLANNDAYTFFAALDALLVTGPTYNNVNDFRAILIL